MLTFTKFNSERSDQKVKFNITSNLYVLIFLNGKIPMFYGRYGNVKDETLYKRRLEARFDSRPDDYCTISLAPRSPGGREGAVTAKHSA